MNHPITSAIERVPPEILQAARHVDPQELVRELGTLMHKAMERTAVVDNCLRVCADLTDEADNMHGVLTAAIEYDNENVTALNSLCATLAVLLDRHGQLPPETAQYLAERAED